MHKGSVLIISFSYLKNPKHEMRNTKQIQNSNPLIFKILTRTSRKQKISITKPRNDENTK